MKIISALESKQMKDPIPRFEVGDTVRVQVKVVEGNKQRLQPFQGVVIKKANARNRSTFTVRKVTAGIGVERVFPVHSPNVADVRGRGLLQAVEVVECSDTARAFPVEARMGQRVAAASFREDVILYPGGVDPARDIVCIGPPFTITDDEIDRIVETLGRAVDTAVGRFQAEA